MKARIAVTHGKGLVTGARLFPESHYEDRTLATQVERATTQPDKIGAKQTTPVVVMGYQGVGDDMPSVQVIQ